jgi:nitrilase
MSDIPKDFELYDALAALGDLGGAEQDILPGGSGIIGPDGAWVVGPVVGREVILYGEIDLDRVLEEKLLLDTVGHYNRLDVFKFAVDDRPMEQVTWMSKTSKPSASATEPPPAEFDKL